MTLIEYNVGWQLIFFINLFGFTFDANILTELERFRQSVFAMSFWQIVKTYQAKQIQSNVMLEWGKEMRKQNVTVNMHVKIVHAPNTKISMYYIR